MKTVMMILKKKIFHLVQTRLQQFTEEEARMPAEFVEVKPGHWVEVHPASVENYKEYLK